MGTLRASGASGFDAKDNHETKNFVTEFERGNSKVLSVTRFASGLAFSAAVLGITGCAVGPDFLRPAAPETQSYTEEPMPTQTQSADTTGGAAQKFVPGADVPGQWWTLYKSDALNKLVDQALKANTDLEAQEAALRQAQ